MVKGKGSRVTLMDGEAAKGLSSGIGQDNYKINNDNYSSNNKEDNFLVHAKPQLLSSASSDCPEIDNQSQYTTSDIKVQKGHGPIFAFLVKIAVGASNLLSAVGVFSGVNAVNDNAMPFEVKTDTVFSNSESMGGGWEIDEGFGKTHGHSAFDIQLNLFNDSFLQLDGEFFEFPRSAGSERNLLNHRLNQDNPNSCLIFSKGTNPNFLASSMPFLSFNTNLGLMGKRASMASISQPNGLWNTYSLDETFSSNLASAVHKRSHNEYVSNIKYLGEPFLSTTTPALNPFAIRPGFLSSLGIAANFSSASNLTDSRFDSLTSDLDFIASPPCKHAKHNTPILTLSSLFFIPSAIRYPLSAIQIKKHRHNLLLIALAAYNPLARHYTEEEK